MRKQLEGTAPLFLEVAQLLSEAICHTHQTEGITIMDINEFLDDTREAILDSGYVVHYCDSPSLIYADLPVAYTVGRTLWDRPELLIVGPFSQDEMAQMLTEAVAADDRNPINAGAIVELDSRPLQAIDADPGAFVGAMAVFGVLRGLQLLWPTPGTSAFPGLPQPTRLPGVLPLALPDPYADDVDFFHGEEMD